MDFRLKDQTVVSRGVIGRRASTGNWTLIFVQSCVGILNLTLILGVQSVKASVARNAGKNSFVLIGTPNQNGIGHLCVC